MVLSLQLKSSLNNAVPAQYFVNIVKNIFILIIVVINVNTFYQLHVKFCYIKCTSFVLVLRIFLVNSFFHDIFNFLFLLLSLPYLRFLTNFIAVGLIYRTVNFLFICGTGWRDNLPLNRN